MDDNYTHLTLIVDRSGSMRDIALEASAGINRMLNEQMAEPGKFTFTITQFDDVVENVTRMNESRDDFKYVLRPRAMTALLDAVGSEVAATGIDLSLLDEDSRPGKVIVLIVTDGLENASRKWSGERVRALVEHQKDKYNWQFQFLGADESALQGGNLGMATTSYRPTTHGTQAVYDTASASLSTFRSAGPGGQSIFAMPEEVE